MAETDPSIQGADCGQRAAVATFDLQIQEVTVMHTANLYLRFLLELAALSGFATLTWTMTQGILRYLAVLAVIVLIGEFRREVQHRLRI